jgi:para-nitrobenzyl esterase
VCLTALISGCGGNDSDDKTNGAISGITVAGSKASVTVNGGGLDGKASDATPAFLGVPFAQAPVGARRWQPPVAAAAWGATRDASQYAKHCPQPGSAMSAQPSVSEDCLYLDVFVPKAVAASQLGSRRAVMVWIYGGANAQGTSETYDPTPIVTSDDVIAVTINYRVGALGFLSHPAIDAEGHLFANYGVMDQQLALRWVQDNIESFGGDRNNVTIFGESAGGLNTLTHLVSPQSAGLFSKAIVESGAYQLNTPSVAASQVMGTAFATRVGCTDQSAACLRGKSVDEILAQQGTVNTAGSAYNQSTADKKILPEPQLAAFSAGRFNRVPVMQGANAHEGRIFNSPTTTQAQYQTSVTAFAAGVGKTGAEALAAYPLSEYGTPFEAASAALGDFALLARRGD